MRKAKVEDRENAKPAQGRGLAPQDDLLREDPRLGRQPEEVDARADPAPGAVTPVPDRPSGAVPPAIESEPPDQATLRIELNIRPKYYMTAMPYTVTSDTADPDDILMPREHHDMRMELTNINGGSVAPGASVLIDVLARNAGLEPTDEVVLHGFAGPWPEVTQADVNLQTNSCEMVQPPCDGISCPDPRKHPALFTCRVQASSFGGLRPGNAIGNTYEIRAPANGVTAIGVWTAAEGMEWNADDNAAALAVDGKR